MTITAAKRDLCSLLNLAHPLGIAVGVVMRSQEHHGHTQAATLLAVSQLMDADELAVVVGPAIKYVATDKLVARMEREVQEALDEMTADAQRLGLGY